MKILGIDLGTTNTYIYGVETGQDPDGFEPGSQPRPIVLDGISDAAGSIATAVLYEDGKPILAGNIAESEFYANIWATPKRRLASQFKPEIAKGSPQILDQMRDFLHILREALAPDILKTDTRVFVGMPSLSREDFRINLGACFTDAGWPKPAFVRESDAALVSCVQSGALDISDIEKKCLILDFGGGTCDYTSVENMDVLENGGDLLYGGRLFDDLFFQVFCRHNEDFAKEAPDSPYEWYLHWVECKKQKEDFSDFLRVNPPVCAEADLQGLHGVHKATKQVHGCVLHAVWFTAEGERKDAFVRDYDYDAFVRDAENYRASAHMLQILAPYSERGGLGVEARDLLAGRQVGLLSWLRAILEQVARKSVMAKVVLTGGSCRWIFVPELVARVFPSAICAPSGRSYEDIAYGLALFPILSASRARVQALLDEKIDAFAAKAAKMARELVDRQTGGIVRLCSQRIVDRDIMPALEEAQKKSMTAEELEKRFAKNIRDDNGLLNIVEEKSRALREEIQEDLDFAFGAWLKENGVLLVPRFVFPAADIGQDFFNQVSVKISRLDSLNLMNFTLTTILPVLAGTATAGAIAHSGEPVSTVLGGGFMFGATWLAARTAPKFLARRTLPKFLLTEKNRRRIVEKNREHIEKELDKAFADMRESMASAMESRLRDALVAMLGRLTVLNQIEAN